MSDPKKKTFMEALESGAILADGAMGTELYRRGIFINRSFEELNLSNPGLVGGVHSDYVKAGAEALETNTFGANRAKLKLYGLEGQTEAINRAGARLAREALGDGGYVLGSIGPSSGSGRGAQAKWDGDAAAASEVFREQAAILAREGVDALILETFQEIGEIKAALQGIRAELPNLPVVAQMGWLFFSEAMRDGSSPGRQLAGLRDLGASVVGVNCGPPTELVAAVEEIKKYAACPVSAMPNCGMPERVDGRTIYLASPEYMAEYVRRCAEKGARLLGGCCGVTPAQIKEIGSFLRSKFPRQTRRIEIAEEASEAVRRLEPKPIEERSLFGANLGKKFMVSVELTLPPGLDPSTAVAGAKFLHENGVDAVNIADGPRAISRMGPAALSLLVKQACGIEPILHVCCRDRNVLALQMDLIGDHALGLRNLMLITGDPPKMGNFPNATAVFDLDAIELIRFAHDLNCGLDMSGKPIGGQTHFVLGTGCNPGAVNLELEAERFAKKVEAGAEYVFCQPVYDIDLLDRFFKLTENVKRIPFFVGILPLASYKNAEFLNENVPGMEVPLEVRERLKKAGTKEMQRAEGIKIAGESLHEAKRFERVKGAYIFPPFGRYEAVLEALEIAGV